MLCDLCRMNLQNVHTSLLVRKRDFCKQKQSNKRHFVVLQVQAFSSPRSLRIIACIAGVSQKHENEKKLRASAHPLTTSPRFFAHSRPARLFDLSACMVKDRKQLLRGLEDQALLREGGEKQRKAGHKLISLSYPSISPCCYLVKIRAV